MLPAGGLAVLIVPIDLQAPKGRLILPQVQTIRDALDNDAAALIAKRHARTPMGRMGDAWDVAYATLYLASDEARFVTGAEILVDGGLTATIRGG